MLATSAQLARLPSGGEVAVAGLVIARQRPGTAKGTMFLLFEDEFGTINLIVPEAVYERHRHLARAEPLLLARGRLERSAGALERDPLGRARGRQQAEEIRPVINVLVRELAPLERFLPDAARTCRPQGGAPALARRRRVGRGARGARRSARACARPRRPSRASRWGAGAEPQRR